LTSRESFSVIAEKIRRERLARPVTPFGSIRLEGSPAQARIQGLVLAQ
jgi:hypothetical protein